MSRRLIYSVKKKWRAIKLLEGLLCSVGMWLFTFEILNRFTSNAQVISLLIASLVLFLWLFFSGFFRINDVEVARFISKSYPEIQNGTELLLNDIENLNTVERVQYTIVEKLISTINFKIPISWKVPLLSFFLGIVLYGLGNYISWDSGSDHLIINSQPINGSVIETIYTPSVESLQVKIIPPSYTGLKTIYQNMPSIEAIENSLVYWEVKLTNEIDSANIILSNGKIIRLKGGDTYTASYRAQFNDFYHFEFFVESALTTTDLFEIRVSKDQSPLIDLHNRDPFQEFDYGSISSTKIQAGIKDDFGINETKIIATVAKGSGESVKFRESEISFETSFKEGRITIDLTKTMDLDSLDLGPGDELYFYVIAIDNKYPVPNITKSETYFVSFKDTSELEFSLAGNLGVDLMPEYFRSQRQIIIDTEKLLKSKNSISTYDFNYTSNELGFDQKVLRLKYGQFMGEEFVSESGGGTEDLNHEQEAEPEDQLAEYTHAHDAENDHNLLEVNDMGEELGHSHDNAEENTYFSMSVRAKLKEAMAQMWDAELYLRLYEPDKSLPYQYKALKLIKEIKNHARIYVQRMGFDPPPIKPLEARLKGKAMEDVISSRARNKYEDKNELKNVSVLLKSINSYFKTGESIQNSIWQNAGNDLAPLAIADPEKYFKELNIIQQFRDGKVENYEVELKKISQALAKLIPFLPAAGNTYYMGSKWNKELSEQLKLEQ